jgi:solute carrier family 6 amino acid transporter-like protein 5/7/9/14
MLSRKTKIFNLSLSNTCHFRNHVLKITDGIDNMGGIRWELLICLIVAWILVFLCLCKGVKSSGKVRIFPYQKCICKAINFLTS